MAINFWKKRQTMIGDILSVPSAREELLGMRLLTPPSEEKIHQDTNRVVSYTNREEYRTWAQDAWSKIITHIDALQNPKARMEEVNFHRGALFATLDLLRVAELARLKKEELDQEAKQGVSSAH